MIGISGPEHVLHRQRTKNREEDEFMVVVWNHVNDMNQNMQGFLVI
ncbi:hypothetical protein Lalb_Chr01g0022901 [Lupinus albus]|uniref:Uncharacterized protein n=1 Tax=Lupinus albus TaxID=3870 RepID=A0A6A4RBF0_LUPAL|nr:hypothetical protein Lalb_Chr01g0022901 [Lupinus albus]